MRRAPCALAAALACATLPVAAQQGGARSVEFVPSVSIGQTVTDAFLDENGARRAEAITTLGAGIRLTSRSGRLQGSVDYSLSGLIHARDGSANDFQNRLQANLTGELIENHLTVDVLGSIAQQAVTALGAQSADDNTNARNRVEVANFSVRPVLRGTLAGQVDLRAAVELAATNTGASVAADSTTGTANLRIGSAASTARLGWSLDGSRQVVDFRAGRRTVNDRAGASLSAAVDTELRLTLRGGAEANDFTSTDRQRYSNWGAGLLWTPTERTRISLDADRRSFGHSHAIVFEHRMRRSVWRYSDQQDLTTGSGDTAGASIGAYDLFFELYKSQQPDPVLREQLVNDLLLRNNLQRDTLIRTGFLTSAITLQRNQELSLALEGQRTSVVLTGVMTSSRRVDSVSGASDSLDSGNQVRQRGLSVAVSHKLTPTAALSLSAVAQKTAQNDGSVTLRTALHSISAYWSDQVSRHANMSLGVRHTEFYGDDAYTENAVTANLRLQF